MTQFINCGALSVNPWIITSWGPCIMRFIFSTPIHYHRVLNFSGLNEHVISMDTTVFRLGLISMALLISFWFFRLYIGWVKKMWLAASGAKLFFQYFWNFLYFLYCYGPKKSANLFFSQNQKFRKAKMCIYIISMKF